MALIQLIFQITLKKVMTQTCFKFIMIAILRTRHAKSSKAEAYIIIKEYVEFSTMPPRAD